MPENVSFSSNVDTLFSDIQNLTRTGTVLGTPITIENKTIVPLMSVTLGYGSTGMGAKAPASNTTSAESGGHGLGAKIAASGVIVVDKNSVQLLSANEGGAMNQMMSKIPQALTNMGQNMVGGGQGQQQGSQNQQAGQQGGQQGGQRNQ